MYISLWENSRGHPDNVSFMQFSMKIDGFEQKDSQGFEYSYNSYQQYPLEKFFIFTIYQNYTLALRCCHTVTYRANVCPTSMTRLTYALAVRRGVQRYTGVKRKVIICSKFGLCDNIVKSEQWMLCSLLRNRF